MATPYTLGNTFRSYDKLIYDWLGGLLCDYGETMTGGPKRAFGILRCFATPTRAFGMMENLLVRKGLINNSSKPTDKATESGNLLNGKIPAPFASITFGDPVPDPTRSFPPVFWYHFSDNFLSYEKHYAPRPYDIPYTIDFWFNHVYTKQHIMEWVLSQFGMPGAALNEMFLTITVGSGWGTKIIPVLLDAFVDNSDLEPGEKDRSLRMSLTVTLKAWLFLPPVDLGEGSTTASTVGCFPLIFKYLDKCRYFCAGEEYGSYNIYDFNLIEYMKFYLRDNSDTAKFNYTGECTPDGGYEMRFFPGSSDDYVESSMIPAFEDSYEFKGKRRGKGVTRVEVWNEDKSTMIDSQEISESYPGFSDFTFSFINIAENGIFYFRIYSDNKVYIRNLSLKRTAYNP